MTCDRPFTSRVARRWALSSWLTSALSVGALASIVYSRRGSTMALYSWINAVFDKSQKSCRTMKSNRLAVFAVSLQCAGEDKVVSRETHRSLTLVTWGGVDAWCRPQKTTIEEERGYQQ